MFLVIGIKVDKTKFKVFLIPCLACSKHVLISIELWVSNLAVRLNNLKNFSKILLPGIRF